MIVTNSYQGLKDKFNKIVLALGNFDGVHVGHQKLITEMVNIARDINGTAMIFTFNPCPLAILDPPNNPPKLLPQLDKEKALAHLGVDVMLSIPFNREFAQITPEAFIRNILHQELAVHSILVGYNYTFGSRGAGNYQTLKQFAAKYNYDLLIVPPVTIEERVVSSTVIRKMMLAGDIEQATKLLGRAPFITGTVVRGEGRGSTIGFPTANIEPIEQLLFPANGVYGVQVVVNGKEYSGLANIGYKPTFADDDTGMPTKRNIEVHLLHFNQDLYQQLITVKFIRRLRDERKFNSVDELAQQIRLDIRKAQNFL